VLSNFGTSIDRGRLSASGNIVGYAGYIYEPATQMYVVRHRWYSAENGRWLTRDPLGYVDGQSVYEALRANPNRYIDPYGQSVRTAMNAVSAVGSQSSTELRQLQNQGSAPQDDVAELRCWGIKGLPFPQHCYVRCCEAGGTICNTYSLMQRDGKSCIGIDHDEEIHDNGRHRGHRYRREVGQGICECLRQVHRSTSGTNDREGCTYDYSATSCNSNWYANSAWKCCSGSKRGAPFFAPFGMSWDCCREDCASGKPLPCPVECPAGSPGAGSNRCCMKASVVTMNYLTAMILAAISVIGSGCYSSSRFQSDDGTLLLTKQNPKYTIIFRPIESGASEQWSYSVSGLPPGSTHVRLIVDESVTEKLADLEIEWLSVSIRKSYSDEEVVDYSLGEHPLRLTGSLGSQLQPPHSWGDKGYGGVVRAKDIKTWWKVDDELDTHTDSWIRFAPYQDGIFIPGFKAETHEEYIIELRLNESAIPFETGSMYLVFTNTYIGAL